jgi:hypothetical protein
VDRLQKYMKERIELTKYVTIYGIRAVGLHWMVYKMEKLGDPELALVTVLDWQDDITSDSSYTQFQAVAKLVYNNLTFGLKTTYFNTSSTVVLSSK